MENGKSPKWDIEVAISAGNESYALLTKYKTQIEPRLKPGEIDQFNADITELAKRPSGQSVALNTQKSNTRGKDELAKDLHNLAVSIRNIVKSSNAPKDILQAYGVGEKMPDTQTGALTAANIVVAAYKANTSWSNENGILEADMIEISDLIGLVNAAGNKKDESVYNRKSQTMDKNLLQRLVEDEVTRIAALGAHVFRTENPAVAALFEGLIPNGGKNKSQNGSNDQKPT